jgi:S-DNA-T family DNA segregation ATPase FtsK/SpoIIIE
MARLTHYTQRMMHQAIGLSLMCFGAFAFLALLSYDSGDPSLNRATDQAVSNLGGFAGAVLSDMSLQVLGLGSLLMVITMLAWGWRMLQLGHIPLLGIRVVAFCVALAGASMLFSFIKAPMFWPVSSGFGGAMGALLHAKFSSFLPAYLSAPLALALLVVTIPVALGLNRREWRLIGHLVLRVAAYVAAVVHLAREAFRGESRTREEENDYTRKPIGLPKFMRARVNDRSFDEEEDDEEVEAELDEDAFADDEDEEPVEEDEEEFPVPTRRGKAEKKVTPPATKKQGTLALQPRHGEFEMPSVSLLAKVPAKTKKNQPSESALKQNAAMLESVLQDFGVHGEIINIRPGPVVTLYELEPAAGTKSSRVIGLADDIARSMSAVSARIAVIPGRNAIGIELPNRTRETVYMRELIEDDAFAKTAAKLPLVLGKDIGGDPIIADLARMPHLLVAGTTGSGKSVSINTMILSLVYHMSPEQCRFIMIDPKMLELSVYDNIPHLLTPVVTEPGKAVVALKWTVKEMENRYRLMASLGVRNIDSYNKRVKEARASGEVIRREVQTGFDPDTGKPIYETQEMDMSALPFIVVIVDEMADLMLVAGKDIEGSIQRLAQMARAAGIHLIMATQRPSVDVITGVIKANFPTRISFQVTSKIDSRTILGEQGAEQLLGQGDMLYMMGGGRISRVHGPFVSDQEVEDIVAFLKTQGEPSYVESVTYDEEAEAGEFEDEEESEEDKLLYDRAVQIVIRDRKASTSYIQRMMKIGYNRAARLIEKMERDGLVGPANHVGKREVLARKMDD